MLRRILALALAGAAATALAQSPTEDPDWKELEAPPPPAVRTQGLVPFEVPSSTLRFGIDPDSIQIGKDSIVRYVVVATSSSGAVNAMYEGLRCGTGEVKTYARYAPGSGWSPAHDPQWQVLRSSGATRHSMALARAGVCSSAAPNPSRAQIVQDLRRPPENRYDPPDGRR